MWHKWNFKSNKVFLQIKIIRTYCTDWLTPPGPITRMSGTPSPASLVRTTKSAMSWTRTPVGNNPRPYALHFFASETGAMFTPMGLLGMGLPAKNMLTECRPVTGDTYSHLQTSGEVWRSFTDVVLLPCNKITYKNIWYIIK